MIHREPDGGSSLIITNWTDVIAVFVVKTAGADADATDVVTIDEERIALIRQVFWDMNEIRYHVQTIKHEDSTEKILHITITSKRAEEMPDIYQFNHSQREALAEILKPEYAQMLGRNWRALTGEEMELTEEQIRDMIAAMPEDISPARRSVVGKSLFPARQSALFLGWEEPRDRLGFLLGNADPRDSAPEARRPEPSAH